MKILMIAPTPFFADRGCHVRILEEARIINKNHKITLATYHLGKNIPGIRIERCFNIPWYKKLSAGPSYHKLYLDFFLLLKCAKLLLTEHYDLIYSHLHEGAFLGELLGFFLRKKVIFDAQGSLTAEMKDHNYLNSKILYSLFLFCEKMIIKKADLIITSSPNTTKCFIEKFKAKRIITLEDGVNLDSFGVNLDSFDINLDSFGVNLDPSHSLLKKSKLDKKDFVKEKLKQELGIKNKNIILYLGVLNEYQGIGMLLNVAKEVIKSEDVLFLIMGYPNVEEYQQKAKELKIENNVIFTGRIDYEKTPNYLKLGDLAVSFKTSETEANLKLYNYLGSGLPCIVTDTPQNRKILSDLGTYVKINENNLAAKKIIELLKNDKKRKALSKKCLEKAKQYSWNSKMKLMNQIINEVNESNY